MKHFGLRPAVPRIEPTAKTIGFLIQEMLGIEPVKPLKPGCGVSDNLTAAARSIQAGSL